MNEGKNHLLAQALIKFTAGFALVAALLLIPAGDIHYWKAWLLMAILFIPMFIAGLILLKKNPALLQKRLDAREKESEQKSVVLLSGLMFAAAFIAAGLNHRFGWLILPGWVSWLGAGLFLAAYALYAEVLRENTYLSRTVEVQENQQVIDTGLYGIVRHPMYMATLVLFLAMPLVLGSLQALVFMLLYPFIIYRRIRNEEEVLRRDLPGYTEYCGRVRYRLIPFVW